MSANKGIDRELFILGEPIETQFGQVRFLTYVEYLKHLADLTLISYNILHIYNQYKAESINLNPEERKEFLNSLEEFKKISIHEYVVNDDHLKKTYTELFKLVLDEENHDRIPQIIGEEDMFMGMRQLVMDMNFITEDPVSDNPEIQEYYDERKKQKQRESGKQSVSDIVTSIVAGSANSFDDVRKWTVIQLYSIYYRIAAFKGFDTSTLFATVSNDVKIESWSKNIDLFEKEELGIKYDEFNKKYGGLFD